MTSISWTDATWNPVTGCTKVSTGCKNCYAERVSKRTFAGQKVWMTKTGDRAGEYELSRGLGVEHRPRRFTDVRCHPERLEQPLRWRKPRRVFVNSMSDLFHEDVPDEFIAAVFGVMAAAPTHTFQILTKRSERMRRWFAWVGEKRPETVAHSEVRGCTLAAAKILRESFAPYVAPGARGEIGWPLPNVWLGVSCENQQTADERIPVLMDTPAAVRFVSAEPLLGAIDFRACPNNPSWSSWVNHPDWVIAGGESGPGFRRMDHEWARSLRDQCKVAGVPFFFKQDSGPRPGMNEDLLGEVIQEWPREVEA